MTEPRRCPAARLGLRPARAPTGRWGRLEVPVPGLHNARNAALAARRPPCAGAPFAAAVAAPSPASPGCPDASSSGARRTASPSSTTTPTCPARCGPSWPRPGPGAGGGWWRSSSPTATRRTAALAGAFGSRLRRRRRGGGDRRLRRRRPADPGGLGPAGGRRGGRRRSRPRRSSTRPSRDELAARLVGSLLEPGDLCLHPRGGRPHHAPRRAAGRAPVVNAGPGRGAELDAVAAAPRGPGPPATSPSARSPPTGSAARPRSGARRPAKDDLLAVRRALAGHRGAGARGGQGVQPAGGRRRLHGPGRPARPRAGRRDHPGGPRAGRRAGATVSGPAGGSGLPVLARRTVEAGLQRARVGGRGPRVGGRGGAHERRRATGPTPPRVLVRYRWLDLLAPRPAARTVPAASASATGRRRSAPCRGGGLGRASGCAPGTPAAGRAALAEIVRWRRQHQPGWLQRRLGLHQPARRRRPAGWWRRPA